MPVILQEVLEQLIESNITGIRGSWCSKVSSQLKPLIKGKNEPQKHDLLSADVYYN